MFNSSTIPYSVPVYPATGTTNGGGLFGGDSWAWIIVLLLIFGANGNGFGFGGFGGGGGSEVQRGFDHQSIITKLDGQTYGLADSTYALNNAITNGFNGVQQTLCQGFNGVNTGMLTGFNGLQAQLADCCCKTQGAIQDVRYDMATQACDTRHAISNSTRDILENQNTNTRAILDFLTQDKISTLQAENQSLRLAASQSDQNAVIRAAIDASTAEIIRRTGNDCPVPAYVVNGPTPINFPTNCCGQFAGFGNYGYNNVGCGCGCGC